ncbi:PRC-barrel domain-containing protein [Methanosalsum natronophilum]|uniref:PRC-barrel domain containing protein n=1 Tax=Methanosalsum natronophilum TaxID=768733 RepID=A0A3R7VUI3_9EURY|nr:PRC-barrel domain-containing protein [Methanosalsum natronophilum]MCS3923983.1 sporulation protein YlmC with PRC-barrel domain [Methanosalsum natronophilum]RQD87853.1 MAG: PRC-barrel domain containing protein [Methanosalsum natronophilum]
MAKIFAKNLSNKQVMATDGSEVGILFNIVMDIKSSRLVSLVIKPDMALDISKYKQEGEYIILPFESVRAIKDYIVIDKAIAKGKKAPQNEQVDI